MSPQLTDSEYAAPDALKWFSGSRAGVPRATCEPPLHLAPSMRSFRADRLYRFVKALRDGEAEFGCELFAGLRDRNPIVLTRSIRITRRWILWQWRRKERAGLVASCFARSPQRASLDRETQSLPPFLDYTTKSREFDRNRPPNRRPERT